MSATEESKKDPESAVCLVHEIAVAMRDNPDIKAVKIHKGQQAVSVATMRGRDDDVTVRRLKLRLEHFQELTGKCCVFTQPSSECSQCELPLLSPLEKKSITILNEPETTTVSRVTCPTSSNFWQWRHFHLPKIVPREIELDTDEHHDDEWKLQMAAAVACGTFGLLGFIISKLDLGPNWEFAGFSSYLLAFVAGAWFVAIEVWEKLRQWVLDVHFLMLAVAFGSATIGALGEGVALLFLFSFSGALEHYALGRTRKEIRSLFKSAPKTATVLDESGHEITVPVEKLSPGQRLHVKPGELFPVDAEIAKGKTACDESNLTGEAAPVDKGIGDIVLAGTLNLWGTVEAIVIRPASQSALQKIISLIREAQHQRAPSQRFTDHFGTPYTWGILGFATIMFLVWWLGFDYPPFVSHDGTKSAFYRAMTLLVVASPCALVLSIPSAVLAAIAWAAKRGILFRGGGAVENLAGVQVVCLDKTGTLTTGELSVDCVESFPPGREKELVQLAFSLERLSNHPLARAITRHGKQLQLTPLELEQFESVTGMGLKARWQGAEVRLGRREWLMEFPESQIVARTPPAPDGLSEVWIARNGLVGRIILRDDIRPVSREVLSNLRKRGLRTVLLTGDRNSTAQRLKEELDLDEVRAELKPEQKVAAITEISKAGKRVAMVGDGVNDAPSLAAADVGIAMGGRGVDAALEQADIVLMHDRLENFLAAFDLSRRARAVIRQNLAVSLGTVVVLVVCAIAGTIPLTVGVVGHEGSTLVVVLNSLRLLFGGRTSRGM